MRELTDEKNKQAEKANVRDFQKSRKRDRSFDTDYVHAYNRMVGQLQAGVGNLIA